MRNLEKHKIKDNASIMDALLQINKSEFLTLFVVNDKNDLIGTLTDGDIRRGLISGKKLSDKVRKFVTKNFHFIKDQIDVKKIKTLKSNGINLLPVIDKNKKILKVYNIKKLNSILPLEAIIMAGGRGERLKPFTDNVPKPMLKVGEIPIIEYAIDRLISFGIETIYISVN